MEVGVLRVPVATAHGAEHHVAAQDFAFVHLAQVHSLVVHAQRPFVTVHFVADVAKDPVAAPLAARGGRQEDRRGRHPLLVLLIPPSSSSSEFRVLLLLLLLPAEQPSSSSCAAAAAVPLGPLGEVLPVAVLLPLLLHSVLLLLLVVLQVVHQDALVAGLVRALRGVDAAAGLHAGGRAQVQHHVVVGRGRPPEKAVVAVVVWVLEAGAAEGEVGVLVVAGGGAGVAVEPGGGGGGGGPQAHPGRHGVQAKVVSGVDLGQELGPQVLGKGLEVGVQGDVIQLFGQQFAVQVDVGAVPTIGGERRSGR